jgi:hypothetical protein
MLEDMATRGLPQDTQRDYIRFIAERRRVSQAATGHGDA